MKTYTRYPLRRRARQEWVCAYCGQTIPVGEVYTQQKGGHVSGHYLYRLHNECYFPVRDILPDEFVLYANPRPTE